VVQEARVKATAAQTTLRITVRRVENMGSDSDAGP